MSICVHSWFLVCTQLTQKPLNHPGRPGGVCVILNRSKYFATTLTPFAFCYSADPACRAGFSPKANLGCAPAIYVAAGTRIPRPSSLVAASREVPPGRRHLQALTSARNHDYLAGMFLLFVVPQRGVPRRHSQQLDAFYLFSGFNGLWFRSRSSRSSRVNLPEPRNFGSESPRGQDAPSRKS